MNRLKFLQDARCKFFGSEFAYDISKTRESFFRNRRAKPTFSGCLVIAFRLRIKIEQRIMRLQDPIQSCRQGFRYYGGLGAEKVVYCNDFVIRQQEITLAYRSRQIIGVTLQSLQIIAANITEFLCAEIGDETSRKLSGGI